MYRKIGDLDDIDKQAISEMIDSMLRRKKKIEDDFRQDGN